MSRNFPDDIKDVDDHRIVGMKTYLLVAELIAVPSLAAKERCETQTSSGHGRSDRP